MVRDKWENCVMTKSNVAFSRASERVIAEGIVDVDSELRLNEVSEFVATRRRDESINVAILVYL